MRKVLALAITAIMAGYAHLAVAQDTISVFGATDGTVTRIVYNWASASDGTATGVTIAPVPGILFGARTSVSTVAQPSNDYNVVVYQQFEQLGGADVVTNTDLMGGALQNLPNTTGVVQVHNVWPDTVQPTLGKIRIQVTNAGSAKQGTVELLVARNLRIQRGEASIPMTSGTTGQIAQYSGPGQVKFVTVSGDATMADNGVLSLAEDQDFNNLTLTGSLTIGGELSLRGDTGLGASTVWRDWSDPDNPVALGEFSTRLNSNGLFLVSGQIGAANNLLTPTKGVTLGGEGADPTLTFTNGSAVSELSFSSAGVHTWDVTTASGDSSLVLQNSIGDQVNVSMDGALTVGEGITAGGDIAGATLSISGDSELSSETRFYDRSTNPDTLIAKVDIFSPGVGLIATNGMIIAQDSFTSFNGAALMGAAEGEAVISLISDNANNVTSGITLNDSGVSRWEATAPSGDASLIIGGGIGDEMDTTILGSLTAGTSAKPVTASGVMVYTPSSATIASGSVAAATSNMILDTEGAAATDDLVTITGANTGAIIILRPANDTRDVVVKHGTGSDNIKLPSGTDFTMDNINDSITLLKTSTYFIEIARTDY